MEELEIPVTISKVQSQTNIKNINGLVVDKYYAIRNFNSDRHLVETEYLHPVKGWTNSGVYYFNTKEDLLECLKRVNLPKKLELYGQKFRGYNHINLFGYRGERLTTDDIWSKLGLGQDEQVKITIERIK